MGCRRVGQGGWGSCVKRVIINSRGFLITPVNYFINIASSDVGVVKACSIDLRVGRLWRLGNFAVGMGLLCLHRG